MGMGNRTRGDTDLKQYWRVGVIKRLRELVASGMNAADIAKEIGRTQASVITFSARRGIAIVRYNPEQQAMYDRRFRDAEDKRNARKRAVNAKKKLDARLEAMKRSGHNTVTVIAAASPTSVGFRAHLPLQREMTKAELREMLAQAVRNTAEMSS
jgi:hypothetical protein